jgi:predicted permease
MMRWFNKAPLRLRSLFRRRRVEQEMNDELRFHLEKLIEENIEQGKSPAEARDAALRELGGLDQFKEECRDVRGIHFIETLLQDFRYGLRMLAKNPGFTAVVVLTLALGISSTSSIFSVVDGIMLRPLPAKDPDQLVWFMGNEGYDVQMSYPDYLDIRRQNTAFSAIVASQRQDIRVDMAGMTKIITGELVSDNYFSALGIQAELGRTFMPDENWNSSLAPPVIISHGLWQRQFGGDPGIIGKEVVFDERKTVVLGVAPPWFSRFRVGMATELWLPLNAWKSEKDLQNRQHRLRFDLLGRLRPGVVKEQALVQLNAIAGQLSDAFPATHKIFKFSLVTEKDLRRKILLLASFAMFGVGLVLVICCANISGMMLARAEARQCEIAVRLAMGAGRGRLLRQLLTESLMLAALGGGLGLLFTSWLIRLQSMLAPAGEFVVRFDLRVDSRVLIFTCGITVLSALITGLAPAWAASKPDLVSTLKKEQGGAKVGRFWLGARSALLVGQIAFSLILVVCAGMFLKSLIAGERIDPGFDTKKNLLSVWVMPTVRGTPLPFIERIRALPGVKNASCAMSIGSGSSDTVVVSIPGIEPPSGQKGFSVSYNAVERNYFQTLGTRILRGRSFQAADETTGQRNVLINERMAERFWPQTDPIDRQMMVGDRSLHVIGMVQDGRDLRNIHKAPAPCIYFPLAQSSGGSIVIETADDPMLLANAVKREILSVDKGATIMSLATMKERLGIALWADRIMFILIGTLGSIGIFLTAVGLYGVVAYLMQRRTQEIGIRLALGASRQDVIRLGLRQGLIVAVIGMPFGLGAAFVAAKVISYGLEGMSAADPSVFLGACALVLCVTLLASYIPARRAAQVNPLMALRHE